MTAFLLIDQTFYIGHRWYKIGINFVEELFSNLYNKHNYSDCRFL